MKTVPVSLKDFFRGGGSLSLAEWIQMDDKERKDAQIAREAVETERVEQAAHEFADALQAYSERSDLTEMVDRGLEAGG